MEHTMFPNLNQGNKLVIQFSNSPHQQQHKISEDQILDDYASLVVNNSDKIFTVSSHQQEELFYEADDKNHVNSNEQKKKKKKMVHREIERQRRQEMATYCASLRSLLPLEFIKGYIVMGFQGKRSTSDHMNEAVNYIKHMQNNIKELGAKRDELKKKHSNSMMEKLESKYTSCNFSVHENNGILGIEITSGLREERFKLSGLLQLLLQEGIEVASCISTEVNGKLLHSVQCEVNNSNSVDLFEMRKKIANIIPTFTTCSD